MKKNKQIQDKTKQFNTMNQEYRLKTGSKTYCPNINLNYDEDNH